MGEVYRDQQHARGDHLDAVLLWYASEVFRAHKLCADPAGTEAKVACEFERLAESELVRRADATGQQALLLDLLAEEGRTDRLKLAVCRLQGALKQGPNPAALDVAPGAAQPPCLFDTFASPPSQQTIETQTLASRRKSETDILFNHKYVAEDTRITEGDKWDEGAPTASKRMRID